MAGSNDDIERLLAEMEALNAQADHVLGGDDSSGKAVQKRRGSQPVPQRAPEAEREGLSPAALRALVVSGIATGLTFVIFLLVAVLPFFARPGLSDVLAIFVSSLLVAVFYTLRGRGGK
jgi:hypothetical protein